VISKMMKKKLVKLWWKKKMPKNGPKWEILTITD